MGLLVTDKVLPGALGAEYLRTPWRSSEQFGELPLAEGPVKWATQIGLHKLQR